jgi:hypothetical protein
MVANSTIVLPKKYGPTKSANGVVNPKALAVNI